MNISSSSLNVIDRGFIQSSLKLFLAGLLFTDVSCGLSGNILNTQTWSKSDGTVLAALHLSLIRFIFVLFFNGLFHFFDIFLISIMWMVMKNRETGPIVWPRPLPLPIPLNQGLIIYHPVFEMFSSGSDKVGKTLDLWRERRRMIPVQVVPAPVWVHCLYCSVTLQCEQAGCEFDPWLRHTKACHNGSHCQGWNWGVRLITNSRSNVESKFTTPGTVTFSGTLT